MSKANLANAILKSPLTVGATSATLVDGYGSTMPPVPFKMTLTPFGQLSTKGNSEIILVTARSADVLTIERAKGGTTAKAFEAGDIISNGIYIENSTAVGDIFMSLRATPAAGRLFMAGGTFAKADYPLLYKLVQDSPAYGTTGGSSGSETFTLADMRERMPFGKSDSVPYATLGDIGGRANHTLIKDNLPRGAWSISWHGQENGTIVAGMSSSGAGDQQSTLFNGKYQTPNPINGASSRTSVAWSYGVASPSAIDLLNPYIVINYEIIAG